MRQASSATARSCSRATVRPARESTSQGLAMALNLPTQLPARRVRVGVARAGMAAKGVSQVESVAHGQDHGVELRGQRIAVLVADQQAVGHGSVLAVVLEPDPCLIAGCGAESVLEARRPRIERCKAVVCGCELGQLADGKARAIELRFRLRVEAQV